MHVTINQPDRWAAPENVPMHDGLTHQFTHDGVYCVRFTQVTC